MCCPEYRWEELIRLSQASPSSSQIKLSINNHQASTSYLGVTGESMQRQQPQKAGTKLCLPTTDLVSAQRHARLFSAQTRWASNLSRWPSFTLSSSSCSFHPSKAKPISGLAARGTNDVCFTIAQGWLVPAIPLLNIYASPFFLLKSLLLKRFRGSFQ